MVYGRVNWVWCSIWLIRVQKQSLLDTVYILYLDGQNMYNTVKTSCSLSQCVCVTQ